MKVKVDKKFIYRLIIIVATFWLSDFIMHIHGAGETTYYYIIKFGNSLLLASFWLVAFDSKKHYKKILYGFFAGTWISFTYLVSSYSGLVQLLGVYARYSPPAFIIFGVYLHPIVWWVYHSLVFYLGLELAGLLRNKK